MSDAMFWMGVAWFLGGFLFGGMVVMNGVEGNLKKGAIAAGGKAYIVREVRDSQ